MAARAGWVTPLLHVADVERSLAWWRRLGFETVDVMEEGGVLGWARAHCEGGALMFLRVEGDAPASPPRDRVLFYLYTPDLEALRARLQDEGVDAGPITRPPYMPSGEICVRDPDGYVVLVGHWGPEEGERWERERRQRL